MRVSKIAKQLQWALETSYPNRNFQVTYVGDENYRSLTVHRARKRMFWYTKYTQLASVESSGDINFSLKNKGFREVVHSVMDKYPTEHQVTMGKYDPADSCVDLALPPPPPSRPVICSECNRSIEEGEEIFEIDGAL